MSITPIRVRGRSPRYRVEALYGQDRARDQQVGGSEHHAEAIRLADLVARDFDEPSGWWLGVWDALPGRGWVYHPGERTCTCGHADWRHHRAGTACAEDLEYCGCSVNLEGRSDELCACGHAIYWHHEELGCVSSTVVCSCPAYDEVVA